MIFKKLLAHALFELPPLDIIDIVTQASACNYEFSESDIHLIGKNSLVGRSNYKMIMNNANRNEGRRFIFWDDEELWKFMELYMSRDDIFECYCNAYHPIIKADLARLCIIYNFGGTYFDLKSCFAKITPNPLDSDELGFFLFEKNVYTPDFSEKEIGLKVANWFLCSKARQRLFYEIIMTVCSNIKNHKYLGGDFPSFVKDLSGPNMLSRLFYSQNDLFEGYRLIRPDDPFYEPTYLCKNAWVRTLIQPHYSTLKI